MILKSTGVLICILILTNCKGQEDQFLMKKELPAELKEISGIAKDGNFLWAITDNKKRTIYKLDLSGNLVQQIEVSNAAFEDVEAVTSDRDYVYVGDVGDNNGTRSTRSIMRIPKSSIGNNSQATASGEMISFTFPDEGEVKNKKSNNYDCEAMISFKDSLYVFTKRRDDMKTELYALPKSPGSYTARSISIFKTKGLVTDAAVNKSNNEIALVGYDEGHTKPFIWILSNFKGNDFFSGNHERFDLTNEKQLDWQVEGISYGDGNHLFLSCEKTKDVRNTVYSIDRAKLHLSKKGND
ncbi:MAG: SdiA-regulated domain-containing protein [Flavisolibacter sp.]